MECKSNNFSDRVGKNGNALEPNVTRTPRRTLLAADGCSRRWAETDFQGRPRPPPSPGLLRPLLCAAVFAAAFHAGFAAKAAELASTTYVQGALDSLAPVATSGAFEDLTGRPDIAKEIATAVQTAVQEVVAALPPSPSGGTTTTITRAALAPDYSRRETTNRWASASSWTVDRDGFVYAMASNNTSGQGVEIRVNGTLVGQSVVSANGFVVSALVPVSVGDRVSWARGTGAQYGSMNPILNFIPPRVVELPGGDSPDIQEIVDSLAPVAVSGSFDDLTDAPDIAGMIADAMAEFSPMGIVAAGAANAQEVIDLLAPVATSGSFQDLVDAPDIAGMVAAAVAEIPPPPPSSPSAEVVAWVPNYSARNTTNRWASSSSWTVDHNGFVYARVSINLSGQTASVRVNGQVVAESIVAVNGHTASAFVPVRAGDVVSWARSGTNPGQYGNAAAQLFWFPPVEATVPATAAEVVQNAMNTLLSPVAISGQFSDLNDTPNIENMVQTAVQDVLAEDIQSIVHAAVADAVAALTPPTVLAAWTVPDYARIESTNRISTNNGTWTADRDGFVRCRVSPPTGGRLGVRFFVNNVEVFFYQGVAVSGSTSNIMNTFPVANGDVVRVFQATESSFGFGSSDCRFIPPRIVHTAMD